MALTNADIVNGVGLGPSWQPWSLPVRLPKGIGQYLQQAITEDTKLIPDPSKLLLGSYPPLAEPVRLKLGLQVGLQQFTAILLPAFQGPPVPADQAQWWQAPINIAHFNSPLAEPVRQKLGLKPGLHQFLAVQLPSWQGPPLPPESQWWQQPPTEGSWHYPWVDPHQVRLSFRRSILTGQQQFLAAPSRLLPTPDVTLTMAATSAEGDDIAELAFNVYTTDSTAVSLAGANVSVSEIRIEIDSKVSIRTEEP